METIIRYYFCNVRIFPENSQDFLKMEKFGEKLRALRIRSGLTLKDLALALGLNAHGYISEIECGKKKPTAEFALKVAVFFDVTTDELLKDELEIQFKKNYKKQ